MGKMAVEKTTVVLGVLGAAAVGVVVLFVGRRRGQHETAPSSKPTLQRAATQSGLTWRPNAHLSPGGRRQFKAFISHMKHEAAMEARFVQSEMESLTGKRCFLDSDDLKDLNHLTDHVLKSEVLVLIQSRSVLHRPWCLIELVTAVNAGIPIIGVSLEGRPDAAYSFESARELLGSLDEKLEALTPGATATLREHQIDLVEAAWLLSSTLPRIISVSSRPHETPQ